MNSRAPDPVRDIQRLTAEVELLRAHLGGLKTTLLEVTEQVSTVSGVVANIESRIERLSTALTTMVEDPL